MWQFQTGYVIIQIEGVYPERLTSLLKEEGVPLRDIFRPSPGVLTCALPAKSFPLVRRLNRRCRCRVKILEKRGGIYALRALWRRRILLVGMTATLALCWWCSHRVWVVLVEGCQRMDESVLRQALLEQGLRPGQNVRRLPLSAIGDYVAAQYEEIAFLGLHVDGVLLRVQVKEALLEGERLDFSVPCDVVASKDGVITALTAYAGRPQVKVGEKVKAGQVLISGQVTARDGSLTYSTHAYGDVLAAVLYRAEVEAPTVQTEWIPTGDSAPYGLLLWGDTPLLERRCPFGEAELVTGETVKISRLPLRLLRGTYWEKQKHERPLAASERREAAMAEAERTALLLVPRQAKIIMLDRHTVEKDGRLYGVCTVTTEENIGITKETNEGQHGNQRGTDRAG